MGAVYARRGERCNNKDGGEKKERELSLHGKKTRTRNTADASAFIYWIKYSATSKTVACVTQM